MVVDGGNLDNETYWRLRDAELQHIQKEIQSDGGYKARLTRLYNETREEIRKDINGEISRFATREGLSMDEARKRIARHEVEEFQDTAKSYVKERNFSDRANEQLRLYNVTMRTNRLEALQARINLLTTSMANEEERLLENHLAMKFIEEYERQAGILAMTIPSQEQLENLAKRVVDAEYRNVLFSDNIWANQNELQHELDTLIRRSILRGENPKRSRARLRQVLNDQFGDSGGGAKFKADRIAITETARVQNQAQVESFKRGGYDQYLWIAEVDENTCEVCGAKDGNVYNLDDTNAPKPPVHPFCRCVLAAYAGRGELEERLDRLGY